MHEVPNITYFVTLEYPTALYPNYGETFEE